MGTKCKYCGSSSFGTTSNSGHPHGCHEHTGVDSKHCVFCNSTSYGTTSNSGHPDGCHKHGSDGQHCIYCGSTSTGTTSNSGHPNKCIEMKNDICNCSFASPCRQKRYQIRKLIHATQVDVLLDRIKALFMDSIEFIELGGMQCHSHTNQTHFTMT